MRNIIKGEFNMSSTNALLLIIGALLWEFIYRVTIMIRELVKVKKMLRSIDRQKKDIFIIRE